MRKQIYYFYKVILSDFLFSMLLILLFSLLNCKVEIFNRAYVILFGFIFCILDYIFIRILDFIQAKIVRKMTYKQIMVDKPDAFIKILLSFKLISLGLMIVSLFISKWFVLGFINIKNGYIIIIISIIIGILRILLNKLLKFDTILINANQQKVQEKLDKMLEEINKKSLDESNDQKLSEEEFREELQKIIKELEEQDKE